MGTAIVGAVALVIGAAIGAVVTWLVASKQRAHERAQAGRPAGAGAYGRAEVLYRRDIPEAFDEIGWMGAHPYPFSPTEAVEEVRQELTEIEASGWSEPVRSRAKELSEALGELNKVAWATAGLIQRGEANIDAQQRAMDQYGERREQVRVALEAFRDAVAE